MRNRSKTVNWIWNIMLLLVSSVLLSVTVFASEADRVPDLTGELGTLTIGVSYQDQDDETIPVEDVGFLVTKVADLKVANGSANYTWLDAFSSCEYQIAGMTRSESLEAAKYLEKLLLEGDYPGAVYQRKTNANGLAEPVPDLLPGMYLVYYFDHPITKDGEVYIEPYLLQVPYPDPENGNAWIYDISSYPKAGVGITPTPTPSPTPTATPTPTPTEGGNSGGGSGGSGGIKTGDDSNILGYLAILLGAGILIAGTVLVMLKKRK